MRTIIAISTATQTAKAASLDSLSPTPASALPMVDQHQRSPWHSPVPYLFGGLAAMLGLIAFALLILACSYWKLSSRLEDREGGERDLESGGGDEKDQGDETNKAVKVFEEKILVIMAGNENPTYLATPVSVCGKAVSFGAGESVADQEENKDGDNEESAEKLKEELGSHENGEAVSAVQNRDAETQQRQSEEEEDEEARH